MAIFIQDLNPKEIAEFLTVLHRESSITLLEDNEEKYLKLCKETKNIMDYLFGICPYLRLKDIILELVNLESFGVLQYHAWLWRESCELSEECRSLNSQSWQERHATTMAELPKLV